MLTKKNKKSGFCVYYFAHNGIGRQIEETDDIVKKKKELGRPFQDNYNIACGPDKKTAIKNYNAIVKKSNRKSNRKSKKKN